MVSSCRLFFRPPYDIWTMLSLCSPRFKTCLIYQLTIFSFSHLHSLEAFVIYCFLTFLTTFSNLVLFCHQLSIFFSISSSKPKDIWISQLSFFSVISLTYTIIFNLQKKPHCLFLFWFRKTKAIQFFTRVKI